MRDIKYEKAFATGFLVGACTLALLVLSMVLISACGVQISVTSQSTISPKFQVGDCVISTISLERWESPWPKRAIMEIGNNSYRTCNMERTDGCRDGNAEHFGIGFSEEKFFKKVGCNE